MKRACACRKVWSQALPGSACMYDIAIIKPKPEMLPGYDSERWRAPIVLLDEFMSALQLMHENHKRLNGGQSQVLLYVCIRVQTRRHNSGGIAGQNSQLKCWALALSGKVTRMPRCPPLAVCPESSAAPACPEHCEFHMTTTTGLLSMTKASQCKSACSASCDFHMTTTTGTAQVDEPDRTHS